MLARRNQPPEQGHARSAHNEAESGSKEHRQKRLGLWRALELGRWSSVQLGRPTAVELGAQTPDAEAPSAPAHKTTRTEETAPR